MDLRILDDDDTTFDNELERIKQENLLLKQQLADTRADNFLKLYEDLKRENAIILQEIKEIKNNKTTNTTTNVKINDEALTKIVQKAILEGAKKADEEVQKSIANINGYLLGIIKRFNNIQNGLNNSRYIVNNFLFWLICFILANIGFCGFVIYKLNIIDNNLNWYFNGLINALNIWNFFK
jgi:hypothetical protein